MATLRHPTLPHPPAAAAGRAGAARQASGHASGHASGQQTALARLAARSQRAAAHGGLLQMVNASARLQAQGRMCALVTQGRRLSAQRDAAPVAAGGLPDALRQGIHQLSGIDLGGVRVHRNSPAPARIGAHAYAQGSQIHLGPGQERHLPHEAWHVVQQKQGRVRASLQAKGIPVNDDAALEQEADRMGERAASVGHGGSGGKLPAATQAAPAGRPVLQGFWLRRHGQPEWINNARKVEAILAPEPAESSKPAHGHEHGAASGTVYRLAPDIELPWEALGRLITALGAAKVQAIEVRRYPLWGSAEGLAAIERQLPNLAGLDLHVLQTLFAQPASDVSQLLTSASPADFARLFGGKREQQVAWIQQGGYRRLQLPLPAASPVAASAAADTGPAERTGAALPQQAAGTPDALAAPAGPVARRAAVQAAVAERIGTGGAFPGRGGPAQYLTGLAQQWAAARIADCIGLADADNARGSSAARLESMALPGAPDGGIFAGVRALVRLAIGAGPYQSADVMLDRRPGTGLLSGDYTDQQGHKHAGAVQGAFAGQLSGLAEGTQPQPVAHMMASGHGRASARLQAKTLLPDRLAGQMDGSIAVPDAFLTLETHSARFEGRGALHAPMDGKLHGPDTHWRSMAGPGGTPLLRANTGRQLLTDGAGNRAVLPAAALPDTPLRAGAGQALTGHLRGGSAGWQHPVRDGQRYSGLAVRLVATQARQAGLFHPDTLRQIVRHAGSAGLARDYVRADGPARGGPDTLHGALLASQLTLRGDVAQLVAARQLSTAQAQLASMRLAASPPVLKPASTAPDLRYASTLQAGASYALVYAGKKYEFKLDTLTLPASWSDGSFALRFRLAHQGLAHYLPVN